MSINTEVTSIKKNAFHTIYKDHQSLMVLGKSYYENRINIFKKAKI